MKKTVVASFQGDALKCLFFALAVLTGCAPTRPALLSSNQNGLYLHVDEAARAPWQATVSFPKTLSKSALKAALVDASSRMQRLCVSRKLWFHDEDSFSIVLTVAPQPQRYYEAALAQSSTLQMGKIIRLRLTSNEEKWRHLMPYFDVELGGLSEDNQQKFACTEGFTISFKELYPDQPDTSLPKRFGGSFYYNAEGRLVGQYLDEIRMGNPVNASLQLKVCATSSSAPPSATPRIVD